MRKWCGALLLAALVLTGSLSAGATGLSAFLDQEETESADVTEVQGADTQAEAAAGGSTESDGSAAEGETEADAATVLGSFTSMYSILLVGSDRRDGSWNGNSDTMIVVTVNPELKKIFLVSYMRDLYADVPGQGVHKLNYAYAYGGASLLTQTLEENYGIGIDNYMAADFAGMTAIADAFGGIDIEIRDEEVSSLNGIAAGVSRVIGADPSAHTVSGGGYRHLDGVLTVAFARIRNVGYYDFERTERQRRILTALGQQVDLRDTAALLSLAKTVLENTDSDLDAAAFTRLVLLIPNISEYELVSSRVPFDGTFYIRNEILTPGSLENERQMIQDLLCEGEVPDQVSAVTEDTALIKQVQQALNDAGFDCGLVDGVMGSKTSTAITLYQESRGLEITGAIDDLLLVSLGISTEE